MKILLITATSLELEGLVSKAMETGPHSLQTMVTGIGLVSTTHAIMQEIFRSRPALIIQAGIAGSFGDRLKPGTAVAVEKEVVADMGVYEKEGYRDIFDMGLAGPHSHPYRHGCLVNPHDEIIQKTGLECVSSVSVNEITTDPKRMDLFSQRYKADIESMEGAALHHACIMQEVPFVQIRGISNQVGERDKSKWKTKEAVTAVSKALSTLIQRL